ncbi:MAG: hypothetical protein F6K23_21605 [Okeania sp. SIO2C9]|uniref:hypothetical protein n=1 Tax=Okeania sp. SIO2C9 TaxID=2607791 RepID=UPI0013C08495|nr:hypothetical protein [Okeania sp. SIO2C9]NEQ75416.1 hypothetical protein [Okeania sp. SIO2C9]
MTENIEQLLDDQATLIIYMVKQGEQWVRHSGGLIEKDETTRLIRASYDWQPVEKRQYEQEIGRRLYSTGSGATLRSSRAIPTEWIVSHVERYEPDLQNMPLFREVIIAYCEKKPMTLEEYKSLVYEREGQVSVESFGGNEHRYQEWLKSNGT